MNQIAQNAISASSHIFTWTSPPELEWLAEHAALRANVVELGCYMGHTTKMLSVACPGPVYAVDHFRGTGVDEVDGVEDVFRYFLKDELSTGKVTLLISEAWKGAEILGAKINGGIDMLFIDAGHQYEDVKRDITAWLPWMRKGGLICGHDYNHAGGWPGVAKAVDELIPDATLRVVSLWAKELP